jgi:hypothetical protein
VCAKTIGFYRRTVKLKIGSHAGVFKTIVFFSIQSANKSKNKFPEIIKNRKPKPTSFLEKSEKTSPRLG